MVCNNPIQGAKPNASLRDFRCCVSSEFTLQSKDSIKLQSGIIYCCLDYNEDPPLPPGHQIYKYRTLKI